MSGGLRGLVPRWLETYALSAVPVLRPKTRFTILTGGRTGSELLVGFLDQHPDITCDGEIFGPPFRFPQRHLRGREVAAALKRHRAYGFKATPYTLRAQVFLGEPGAYIRTLSTDGYKIIWLYRRNLIQHAFSHIHARERQFHYRPGEERTFQPLEVDAVDLLAHMQSINEANDLMASAVNGLDHLALVYEDDLERADTHQATADRVARYLGLKPKPVAASLIKVAPRLIEESIANWDEVAGVIATTRFAPLLADRS
jgi:hypothetical protein